MQQVPKEEQGLFGRMTALMGGSYILHTPEALRDALRRGSLAVHHPYRAGPFYLLLPLNTQPQRISAQSCSVARSSPDLPELAPVDDQALCRSGEADCGVEEHHHQGRRRHPRT